MVKWAEQLRDMRAGLSRGYPDFLFSQLTKKRGGDARTTLLREHQLKGLWDALHAVRKVPGDLVETGVMHGGASILMALANKKFLGERHQWMFDTWEGFPEDKDLSYGRLPETIDRKLRPGNLTAELKHCKENFRHFGAENENQHFTKGCFRYTTEKWDRPIALLRLDGDLYSSTREVLENMERHVVHNGIIIIDDYLFDSCRQAVKEYRERNHIDSTIFNSDGSEPVNEGRPGAWWRKKA